ncbi:MAG TPA: hypothetical protein VLJ37_08735 [bacterium]|nr:hypothetical protein [bacterium]
MKRMMIRRFLRITLLAPGLLLLVQGHLHAQTLIKNYLRDQRALTAVTPPASSEEPATHYRYVIDRVEGVTEVLQKNCEEASPCLYFGPLVRASKDFLGSGGTKTGSEPFNRRLEMKFVFPPDAASAAATAAQLDGCRKMFQMKMGDPLHYRLEVTQPVSEETSFTCEIVETTR